MIQITLTELKEALEEAYEAGWHGCLELKKSTVLEILDKRFPNKDFAPVQGVFSQLTLNGDNGFGPFIGQESTSPEQLTLNCIDTTTITIGDDLSINGESIYT